MEKKKKKTKLREIFLKYEICNMENARTSRCTEVVLEIHKKKFKQALVFSGKKTTQVLQSENMKFDF